MPNHQLTAARVPPVTAEDAMKRLEAVRSYEQLVRWAHELRESDLLGEDGYTNDLVRYWGRLCPGEVPPQAVALGGREIRLPTGECCEWSGDWKFGQWKLRAQVELPEAA